MTDKPPTCCWLL